MVALVSKVAANGRCVLREVPLYFNRLFYTGLLHLWNGSTLIYIKKHFPLMVEENSEVALLHTTRMGKNRLLVVATV